MNRLPRRQAWIGFGVPVRMELVRTEQAHLAPSQGKVPASTMPDTLVFLPLESVSATPYSPASKPTAQTSGSRDEVVAPF